MHPDLRRIAARQLGIFTGTDARRAGYRPDEVRALLSTGSWRRLRRGVYIDGERYADVRGDERTWHITQCAAVLVALGRGPVISHSSAARIHRLVVPAGVDNDVRLTDAVQWRRGRGYRVARAQLPADGLLRLASFRVTGPARTLVDCAREWSLVDSVVAVDGALHAGQVTRAQVEAAVRAGRHWVGIGDAGRACSLADGRAESPLETRGRLALLEAGLPLPELQVELRVGSTLLARVDAWYDEAAVAVEFDGRVKYLDPRGGVDPGEVLWREKRREDRVRELGVRFVRLGQADVGAAQRRALGQRLGSMLTTPLTGARGFTVVRTPEPGSSRDDAA